MIAGIWKKIDFVGYKQETIGQITEQPAKELQ